MKPLSVALFILGSAAIAAAMALYSPLADRSVPIQARIDSLTSSRAVTRKHLIAYRLKLDGYRKSLGNIPDSVRAAQSGQIIKHFKTMSKKKVILGHRESDQTRQIYRMERELRRARARRRRPARPLAAGGAFLALIAVVLRSRPRR